MKVGCWFRRHPVVTSPKGWILRRPRRRAARRSCVRHGPVVTSAGFLVGLGIGIPHVSPRSLKRAIGPPRGSESTINWEHKLQQFGKFTYILSSFVFICEVSTPLEIQERHTSLPCEGSIFWDWWRIVSDKGRTWESSTDSTQWSSNG